MQPVQKKNREFQDVESAIDDFKKNIGKVTHLELGSGLFGKNNETATKDAIRHFANGIGDNNPLWRDTEYARHTKYKKIIAPPLFVNAIALAMGASPIPGFSPLIAGAEWEWFAPIYLGDTFSVTDQNIEIKEKTDPNRKGPRKYIQIGKLEYRNQSDEIVCICQRKTVYIEKAKARKINIGKASGIECHPFAEYTKNDLERIEQAYKGEIRRGTEPRYWEDISEGDELHPIVKGPLTHGDMVAFVVGIGWLDEAHGLTKNKLINYPDFAYRNPETGIVESRFSVHFVDPRRFDSVLQRPIAFGIQTCSWLGHLVTNWMGDDAFLKKLSVQCKSVIYHGDTTWCKGRVIKKESENDEFSVDCEIWAENQKGETTALGSATVCLPTKN